MINAEPPKIQLKKTCMECVKLKHEAFCLQKEKDEFEVKQKREEGEGCRAKRAEEGAERSKKKEAAAEQKFEKFKLMMQVFEKEPEDLSLWFTNYVKDAWKLRVGTNQETKISGFDKRSLACCIAEQKTTEAYKLELHELLVFYSSPW